MSNDPLKDIYFFSVPEEMFPIEDVPIDPKKLLPIELNMEQVKPENFQFKWEMVSAAMLKVLAYKPDHEDAEYYRKILRVSNPNLVLELMDAAIVKMEQEDFALAEEIYKSLINYEPENLSHELNIAILYEHQGHTYRASKKIDLSNEYFFKAFHLYKKLSEKNLHDEDLYFQYGLMLYNKKDFIQAEENFKSYLEIGSNKDRKCFIKDLLKKIDENNKKDELFLDAVDDMRMQKPDEAIKKIKEYIKIEPEFWNAWFILGWAYRKKEKYEEAFEAFEKSLELGCDRVDVYNELGICLLEMDDYKESREYLLKAVNKEPKNIKFLSNLGMVFFLENNLKEAKKYFKKVIKKDPNDSMANYYLKQIELKFSSSK